MRDDKTYEKWVVELEAEGSDVRVYMKSRLGIIKETRGRLVSPPSKREQKKGITFRDKIRKEKEKQQLECDLWNRAYQLSCQLESE